MRKRSLKAQFHSEYGALKNAIDRTSRASHPQFKDYGGRGLTVDAAFLDPITGFETFLAEVGPKPSPELTLERIQNSKGYEPGNLAWTSRGEQARNRRRSEFKRDLGWGTGTYTYTDKNGRQRNNPSPIIPLGDRVQTLSDWAQELGLKNVTIKQRIQRGLSPAEALVPIKFNPHGNPRQN